MRYNITKHCRDRYIERILGNLNNSPNIFIEMLTKLSKAKNITSNLSDNVPRFILYVKERYGADKGYTFLKSDSLIFILVKRKNTFNLYDVITCYVESDKLEQFKNTKLSKKEIYNKLHLLKSKINE